MTLQFKQLYLVLTLSILIAAPKISMGISFDGVFEQGALVFGKAKQGSEITQDGIKINVDKSGSFLIGFSRKAKLSTTLNIKEPNSKSITKIISIKEKKYAIQRIDGLPKSKVSPNKQHWEQISSDIKAVKAARKNTSNNAHYLSGFIWPATGRISGVYGSQRILNGKPKRPHFGVDIARPTGTPIKAPADGIVTLAHTDMFYTGGTIILDHGYSLSSSFLHLSKLSVKVGQKVKQGDVIGEIGSTGRATGPHLDWRMNLLNKRVNPETIVAPMPST